MSTIVRVPDPLPQEMGRGTNVLQSGEFFLSGLHSSELVMDGEVWLQSGTGLISGSSMHCPIFDSPNECCATAPAATSSLVFSVQPPEVAAGGCGGCSGGCVEEEKNKL